MKIFLRVILLLFIIQTRSPAGEKPFPDYMEITGSPENTMPDVISPDSNDKSATHTTKDASNNFIIHYGLNDSHGRSWVREDENGIVGISYFQRFPGNYTEGILFYKTINPDGTENTDSVTTGVRLEKSVLLYDADARPHIFVARSDDFDQVIEHYFKDSVDQWQNEVIVHFYNEGGKFIYELSADNGPDQSFHLLLLKTRSNIDSDDFLDAWLNSNLYHLTNASGLWVKELVYNYNMAWTFDMCIKSSGRQDIKVDDDGFVHIVYSVQTVGNDYPSRLWYATNKTGTWQRELAFSNYFGSHDDAGWYPSLCLDSGGVPHISCMYVNRVPTLSAVYCKLFFIERQGANDWQYEIIADQDDGYYGSDGRKYTGALTHLVFDEENTPHIIFSDIASSHYDYQRLCVGNIRYAVLKDGSWNIRTIYRQPLPAGFFDATEMHAMCLVVPEKTDTIRVIGVEMVVTGEYQYTCDLLDFAWAKDSSDPNEVDEEIGILMPDQYKLSQNCPNPFNPGTIIEFDLPRQSRIALMVYNILGQQVDMLVNDEFPAGSHSVYWDGTDCLGSEMPTGIYIYRLIAGNFTDAKKMLLMR